MFVTKKFLSRRTLLKSAGVTLALPFLDSMMPAQTPIAKTAANVAPRFMGIFSAHGWSPTYWADNRLSERPATEGYNVGLGFIHKPLEPFKDQLTICSGLDSTASMPPPGTSGGDHARAAASLTGAPPKKTGGPDIWCGTSVDQLIAQKYGQETVLPSMQIGIEDPGSATGVCGWGYSCAYTNSISWAAANKPLPHEVNPMIMFERLVGDGANPEQRLARKKAAVSVLDGVTNKIADMKRDLPHSDRARLDDYLDNVREIERRLQLASKVVGSSGPGLEMPFGPPPSIDEHIKLVWDIQHLAFQADITRVSAMMFCRDESSTSYPESGTNTANHGASHHGEDDKRREDWAKINRYFMKTFAGFAKKMKETPDGDGNLLDHTLLFWTSNMGNGNQHSHVNVGSLMLGGASGRHHPKLNINSEGPTSNLLLTLLHMYDIDAPSIGDSTRAVAIG
jgi:hypothetical protein